MKKALKIFGRIMTIVAVLYIVKFFFSLEIDIEQIYSWKSLIGVFIVGSIILALCVYGMGWLWGNILKTISGKEIRTFEALRVYVKANIGKYLPGNVMHYVERNLFAVNAGLGQKEITLSSVMEIATEICAAGLIALLFLQKDLLGLIQSIITPKWICVVCILVVILLVGVIIGIKKNEGIRSLLKGLCSKRVLLLFLKSLLFYSVLMGIMGVILMLIIEYPLGCTLSLQVGARIIACYIIAWLFGFIVPGAPGGIGVREAVLIMLLGAYVGEEQLALAIIIHRVITIVGDVLAYLTIGCQERFFLGKEKKD